MLHTSAPRRRARPLRGIPLWISLLLMPGLVAELRGATPQDDSRAAAQKVFAEGEQLRAKQTAEHLRQAVEKYQASIPLWRAANDRAGEAAALNNIGIVHRSLGENLQALKYLEQALPLRRAAGDRRGEAETLSHIGGVNDTLGEKQKGIDSYDQALALARAAGDRKGEVSALNSLGLVYDSLGETQKALDLYNRALPLARSVNDRQGEARIVNNLGKIYQSAGENQKALDHYNQALSSARTLKDLRGESLTLNNIGVIYRTLGENQKALDFYHQALALDRKIGNRQGEVNKLNNIGLVFNSQGERQKALDYFNEALPLARAAHYRAGEAVTLHNLGEVYDSLGEKQKALAHEEQALLLRRAIGDRRGEAYVLIHIGSIYGAQGDKEKALDYYRQALAHTLGVKDFVGETLTRAGMARVERERGNLTEARAQIEAALAMIESTRSQTAVQELRASHLASVQKEYEFYIDLLMRLHKRRPSEGHDAAALRASERARARGLLELLLEARADIRQGVDPQLLERERALQQKLNAGATRQTQLLSHKHTEEQAQAIAKEVEALAAEYQQVQGQIRRGSPRYAALTQFVPLSLKETQQLLDAETMLLEYAPGEERTYLWAVTQNAIDTYELPARAELEAAARRVYEALSARQPRPGQTIAERKARVAEADARYWHEAARLSQTLLPAAIPRRGIKRLLVVAGGALQFVPFAALPAPQGPGDGGRGTVAGRLNRPPATEHRPLILEHEIVSLPSASVLAALRREASGREAAAKAVAVLADPVFEEDDERVRLGAREVKDATASRPPISDEATSVERAFRGAGALGADGRIARLPFTRREAERIIAAAPPGAAFEALDFKASRATALSAELGRHRVVHFATHGLINTEHPELSGVVLSLVDEGGAPQDGFLRLHEVYNLQLAATELVVLSACQTGLGKEVKGEGLVGLTRGFMYAGAPRVMASLWKVDDAATAELMGQFYQGVWREGLRPPAALRAAQVRMWEQKRWRAPYFWAAFTLQGEWK